MNCRKYPFILTFLLAAALAAHPAENRTLQFGPDTGPVLVFTTPGDERSTAVAELEEFAAHLEKFPPPIRVRVIITANDRTDLPPEIRGDYPAGTNRVISLLEEQESGAVIIVLPGRIDSALIKNGVKGRTAPRWILEAVTNNLEEARIPAELAEYRLPLYRIGWIPEDPLLAAYLGAGIPALILETGADLDGVLAGLVASFADGLPSYGDRHYLVWKIGSRFVFAGEGALVVAILVASAAILFFLFVFSFLFGKKSSQHLKDLFNIWWMPFLYLAVNIVCLSVGGTLVSYLFRFRFGTADSWTLVPTLALAGKLVFSWFFITLVVSLNQLIRFPEDNFIYGYIASVMCLINLFLFSSLDFSLSLLFLSVYCISFAVYHVRHPVSQAIGILVLFIPFWPYVRALAAGGTDAIQPLYAGTGGWNLLMALFAMPFQFLLSRFFHSVGVFGRKTKFYLPFNLLFVFVIAISYSGVLLFLPAWSQDRPLVVPVRQTIDAEGSRLDVRTPVKLANLVMETDRSLATAPDLPGDPSRFLGLRTTSRKFLERQLVTVTIDPVLDAQKIEVTVTSENGLSVFDASLPYELRKAGQESLFISGDNPDTPFIFTFSSDLASSLSVTVRLWTRSNPWGITVTNKDLVPDYLLDVVQTVAVPPPAGRDGVR